jgi:transposase
MVVVDGEGIPLGSQLASASPAEVTLCESTLGCIKVGARKPLRVVADRAYDSDPLRKRLLEKGMLLISPHRKNRSKPAFNDGRWLRRYRKRWKIERTFAWLGNFRRLVVRYEYRLLMYQAFFHLACLLITLRYL